MRDLAKERPSVLVQGPVWDDAEFYGKWLLAASTAQAAWKQVSREEEFLERVDRLFVAKDPDFGIAASQIIMGLWRHCGTCVISMDTAEAEDFVMMLGMGFFKLARYSYSMTIPSDLTATKLKMALLKLAQTEDNECMLHPEHLVIAMALGDTEGLQKRFKAIEQLPITIMRKP